MVIMLGRAGGARKGDVLTCRSPPAGGARRAWPAAGLAGTPVAPQRCDRQAGPSRSVRARLWRHPPAPRTILYANMQAHAVDFLCGVRDVILIPCFAARSFPRSGLRGQLAERRVRPQVRNRPMQLTALIMVGGYLALMSDLAAHARPRRSPLVTDAANASQQQPTPTTRLLGNRQHGRISVEGSVTDACRRKVKDRTIPPITGSTVATRRRQAFVTHVSRNQRFRHASAVIE